MVPGFDHNIGILLGEPSGGLVDIDLDSWEAVALADLFLPATNAIFGRKSAPASHRLYLVPSCTKRKSFEDSTSGDKKAMIVEVRTTGQQTVVPPSIHPSGEPIAWVRDGDPSEVDEDELLAAVQRLAAAVLLVRTWPGEGSRQNAALSLVGGLLRADWDLDSTKQLIRAVSVCAGDDEADMRVDAVEYTARKLEEGGEVTGWPTLKQLIGEKTVDRVIKWLKVREKKAASPTSYAGFPLTDYGNAQRMAARHGNDLRYCRDWKKFLVWDSRRWVVDRTDAVMRLAKETVRAIYAEAASASDADDRKQIANHAKKSESEMRLKAMIELVKSEPGIGVVPQQLDTDPWLLAVENGVVNLRTGILRPHDRADLITKIAPVRFDAQATCPTWNAFLERIMSERQPLIAFVQRVVGYTLCGDTSERSLFVLHGVGANGKSTLLDTIRSLLGDYAARTPVETLLVKHGNSIPNDVARLQGKRYVYASEADEGRRLAEALVKDLTGGDRISARYLYGEFFEFTPEFKLFLATNHKPEIRGTDNGIWDRIKLIPFDVRIPEGERDRNLGAKLRGELSGILNWAVQGCLDMQRDGLIPPVEVRSATEGYRSEMDQIASFIEDCCDEGPHLFVISGHLYETYTNWCDQNRERALTQKAFATQLKARDFVPGKGAQGIRLWEGIGLKPDEVLSTKF